MRGFVISGTGSGVGKTSVATGLMSRLSKGHRVQAFKAGPDFIDPMYHTAATGRPARNLDSFLMDDGTIRNLVGYASRDADLCVVEGVRGLYEGFSGDGDLGSTAHIAKLLGLPVILVVDARSLTRSAAAIVRGFRSFDPDVRIAGVILNNVSGGQHEAKLRTSFEAYCPDVRVLGTIHRDPGKALEQRYLGLRTLRTFAEREITPLQDLVSPIDLDAVMDIAESVDADLPSASPYTARDCGLTAAVPTDEAFCFYYRENIECLEASGFEVRTFGPVDGDPLPDADLYYLGGGYPELHAREISENRDFTDGLASAAADGKAIIGECGGLMALCRSIEDADGRVHRMSGVLDAEARMTGTRHGPTYVMADANADNPLFSGPVRGHEYHYSDIYPADGSRFGFDVRRGLGISGSRDGLVRGNAVGSYMHQHALSERDWIGTAVERILSGRRRRYNRRPASEGHGTIHPPRHGPRGRGPGRHRGARMLRTPVHRGLPQHRGRGAEAPGGCPGAAVRGRPPHGRQGPRRRRPQVDGRGAGLSGGPGRRHLDDRHVPGPKFRFVW